MDDALARTLEALYEPTTVTWNPARPAPGEEPKDGELFIGTGARDATLAPHPRMLSWKLPQWRESKLRSCTEAVLRSAEALDGLAAPLVLRAHEPTLDTLTACFLAVHRVLHRAWPEGCEALAEYVSEWEQGRTEAAGTYDRALASVYYASLHVFRAPGERPPKELPTLLAKVLGAKLEPRELAELPPPLIAHRIARRLKADADLYKAELSRGFSVQLDLPLDETVGSSSRRIDALFLSSPQDVTVLKLLARPDAVNSSYGRGFELLAIHAPNEGQAWARHTISLAPESPGTLADLALLLDREEGPNAPDGTPRKHGASRFTHQPAELEGLSDPWYADGYAWPKGRSTIVAPPFVGTRLSREQIWETIWQRFNVGKNVHLTSSRTLFARPWRAKPGLELEDLERAGWKRSTWKDGHHGLLPSVMTAFYGDGGARDVEHVERPCAEGTVHLSLYPSELALVWVERAKGACTLLDLATEQAKLAQGQALNALPEVRGLSELLEPVGESRWLVYGAYRVNRARSTMLDGSRSVLGLFHALASGTAPTLAGLPSEAAVAARKVLRVGDTEHWFTSTGGARLELELEDRAEPPHVDQDFALFLLTTGQRYVAFELTRRMSEVERQSRTGRFLLSSPTRALRGDVMFFTNSLWFARVSDDPDLDARYDAWRELFGMRETVDSLRSQTTELDEYRKERFENMVGVLLFVFLPLTIVTGFFSGAQFNEMDLSVGLPWTTGGWKIFLIYMVVFTVVVFGAVALGRVATWRKR